MDIIRAALSRIGGIIYCAFDCSNGKFWVGQTWMSLERRKYFHMRDGSMCRVFKAALHKRSGEFIWSVLVSDLISQDQMDAAESAFIIELNSIHPSGYNLKHGGSRGKNSDELNRKISEGMKGKNIWSKGRKQSPDEIRRRVETTKARGKTRKGRKASDDVRAKMRAGWAARRKRLNG